MQATFYWPCSTPADDDDDDDDVEGVGRGCSLQIGGGRILSASRGFSAGVSRGREGIRLPSARRPQRKTLVPQRDVMLALLPVLRLASLVWTEAAQAWDPDLPFVDYLDDERLVCVKWGFDDARGNVTFKFIVNSTGWIGFGLSPHGDMTGADLVMGGVGPGGTYFKDYYSTENSYPAEDRQQSYTLLSLTESQGQTLMTFSRAFQTCDEQDLPITAQPMKLIYAYGTTDEIGFHAGLAGTKEVNLLNFVPRTTVTNGNYISATMENITIPAQDTYHHCKVMKLPTLIAKHHIVQMEPAIEHADMVRRVLLSSCPPYVTTAYDGQCYRGHSGDHCLGIVGAWAVGGQIFELPENTGIPIGGGDGAAFYRLEIHYSNPNGESGRTDSSGLRLHYTDQLRPHDVGVLSAGVSPSRRIDYDIPPRAAKFRTYGVCNTSLFSQIINPVPDLHVFAVTMYTHAAGREVRVGHFRNGEQIGFLGVNPNYDFNSQEVSRLGSIETIEPGDDIVVECSYGTSDRTAATQIPSGRLCFKPKGNRGVRERGEEPVAN
ncbi:DBH-like monooxygenase protein 2 homolog isoform X2 [Phyllopteryx taeniolatus]|uniref:DBH-like monooxygenase protein 2 homolog isoform X2 n=1 Tax=Phyllopteryx taeniolatus TaxID=161469 RepID=UPI002AD306E8|nr:DBH-like monooxygenase protein 2 homolog isoform X2 [Phyllopteryx taeniolatus]